MYKTYKFRLYPTEEQKTLLNKTFGCCRFIYNYYLNDINPISWLVFKVIYEK